MFGFTATDIFSKIKEYSRIQSKIRGKLAPKGQIRRGNNTQQRVPPDIEGQNLFWIPRLTATVAEQLNKPRARRCSRRGRNRDRPTVPPNTRKWDKKCGSGQEVAAVVPFLLMMLMLFDDFFKVETISRFSAYHPLPWQLKTQIFCVSLHLFLFRTYVSSNKIKWCFLNRGWHCVTMSDSGCASFKVSTEWRWKRDLLSLDFGLGIS